MWGHNETGDSFGNFRETSNLMIKRDSEIQDLLNWIDHILSCLSKTIQNDLISCISEYLSDYIDNEIKESSFSYVHADHTTSVLEKSQCAISIRYVNKRSEIW